MKTIIVNEHQAYTLGLLSESGADNAGDSQFLDGTDTTKELGTSQISANGALITDRDGDEIPQGEGDYASPQTDEKIGDMQTIQQGWAYRRW